MIVERRWEKRCDVCNKLLAVKKFIFFKTVRAYVPVGMEFDGFFGNETLEKHICQECWMRIKECVKREVAEDGN